MNKEVAALLGLLQWGRTGEGPEIPPPATTKARAPQLQWGRTGEGPEIAAM